MSRHPDRPARLWLFTGLLAYLILPWYAIQDTAWYTVLSQILSGPETASGLVRTVLEAVNFVPLKSGIA